MESPLIPLLGRRLMSQTSGGLYERFFEEVGKPMDLEAGGGALLCLGQGCSGAS
jgi:hypothetical protein